MPFASCVAVNARASFAACIHAGALRSSLTRLGSHARSSLCTMYFSGCCLSNLPSQCLLYRWDVFFVAFDRPVLLTGQE